MSWSTRHINQLPTIYWKLSKMCSHIRIFTYLCLSGVYPMIGLYIWSKSLVCSLRKVCNKLIMNFIIDLCLSFTYFLSPRNFHCCRSLMQGRRQWRGALCLSRTEDWICFPWCICLGARRMVHPHPFFYELSSAPPWIVFSTSTGQLFACFHNFFITCANLEYYREVKASVTLNFL